MRIPLPDPDWKLDFRVLQHWLSLAEDPATEPGLQRASRRMAAVLIQIVGPNRAASAVTELRWREIEALTFELARLTVENLSEYEVDVLAEHDRIAAELPPDIGPTGIDYARTVLEKAVGVQGAIDIINRLTRSLELPPFDEFRTYDPHLVLNLLEKQHPQIIALVLCNLETPKAALLLSAMDSTRQAMIVQRIAELREVARESVKLLDRALNRELLSAAVDPIDSGGPQRAAEIVESLEEESQRDILMRVHPDLLFEMLERSPQVLQAVNDRIQSEDRSAADASAQDQEQMEKRSDESGLTGDAGPADGGDPASVGGGQSQGQAEASQTEIESSAGPELDPFYAQNFAAAMPIIAAQSADDLSALLGIAFQFRFESLETLDYAGFRQTREEPAVVVVMNAEPLPGRWLLELSAAISFACVDRLAGGPGLPLRPERECTGAETALLDRVVEPILGRMSDALGDHHIFFSGLADAIHPGLLHAGFVALPGDMVYRVRFAARVGESAGWMSLIVPIKSLAAMSEDSKAAEA